MLSVNQDNGKIEIDVKCEENVQLNFISIFLGPHREMAVDVPESFIARNKTPPRYPPPRPPVQVNKTTSINNHTNNHHNNHHNNHDHHQTKQQHQQQSSMIKNKQNAMPQVPPTNISVVDGVDGGGGGVSLELEPIINTLPSTDGSQLDSLSFSNNSSLMIKSSLDMISNHHGSLSTNTSRSSSSYCDDDIINCDYGPHRELPVDVPDSFIEIIKVPPRYPPPPSLLSSLQSQSHHIGMIQTKPLIVDEVIKSLNGSRSKKQMPEPQTPIIKNEVCFFNLKRDTLTYAHFMIHYTFH